MTDRTLNYQSCNFHRILTCQAMPSLFYSGSSTAVFDDMDFKRWLGHKLVQHLIILLESLCFFCGDIPGDWRKGEYQNLKRLDILFAFSYIQFNSCQSESLSTMTIVPRSRVCC